MKTAFIYLGLFGGTFFTIFQNITKSAIGMHWAAFCAFGLLFFLDWPTGIIAAKHRGEIITSKKLSRILFRFTLYSVLLILFHTFSIVVVWPASFGVSMNFAEFAYWFLFTVIVLRQTYSILENRIVVNDKIAIVMMQIFDSLLTGAWKKVWLLISKKDPKL